jgi:mRNA deadenylase 3'-5' endonuclease subunit Ccr4
MRQIIQLPAKATGKRTVSISIKSYNVLAQVLVKRELYPYCTKSALKLKTRLPRVLKEILEFEPDIICLQELDFFDSFYKPELPHYDYLYLKKEDKESSHGLLTLYNRNAFELVASQDIRYDQLNDFNSRFVVMETGNMAQILCLRHKETSFCFNVSNTHLYWRPEAQAVKVI